ncbi:MAG: hypothetical protein AAF718_00690 [Pseudomonadota bacterium]
MFNPIRYVRSDEHSMACSYGRLHHGLAWFKGHVRNAPGEDLKGGRLTICALPESLRRDIGVIDNGDHQPKRYGHDFRVRRIMMLPW